MDPDRPAWLAYDVMGGISVFAPDGTLLGSIETGVATSNLVWGDDGSMLYITAIYRIRLNTRGAACWPAHMPAVPH